MLHDKDKSRDPGSCVLIGTIDRTGVTRNAFEQAGIETRAVYWAHPRIDIINFCKNQPELRVVAIFTRPFDDAGASLIATLRRLLPKTAAVHALVEGMFEDAVRAEREQVLRSAGAHRVTFSPSFKTDQLVQVIRCWFRGMQIPRAPEAAPAPAGDTAVAKPPEKKKVATEKKEPKPKKPPKDVGLPQQMASQLPPREEVKVIGGQRVRIVRLLTGRPIAAR